MCEVVTLLQFQFSMWANKCQVYKRMCIDSALAGCEKSARMGYKCNGIFSPNSKLLFAFVAPLILSYGEGLGGAEKKMAHY